MSRLVGILLIFLIIFSSCFQVFGSSDVSTIYNSKGKIEGIKIYSNKGGIIKYYDNKGKFLGEEIAHNNNTNYYDNKGKLQGDKFFIRNKK